MKHLKVKPRAAGEQGFSMIELLLVVAIVSIVSAFALLVFQRSNKSFRLDGETRVFSGYLERARIDAIRRHAGSSVTINSATSYTVSIDFDGTGTASARTVTLPQGISLSYRLPPATTTIDPGTTPVTISYDWRGRTGTAVLLTLSDSSSNVGTKNLVVGPAGDVSTDTTVTGPVTAPTPQTSVGTTTGIKSMQ